MTAGTGGTVTPSSGWKNAGTTVSINATPTNNTQVSYAFTGWTGTGTGSYSGTNSSASITMSGPITEMAAFSQNPISVIVQTSPTDLSFTVDGTAYTASGPFPGRLVQATRSLRLRPRAVALGFNTRGVNWSDARPMSHTVASTGNITYTATFTKQYYLTMGAGAGGTVSPASGWRNSGATISISATPGTGYSRSGWTATGTGSFSGANNPASITMAGPITEAAAFTHN